MTRGKNCERPRIVVVQAAQPRYKTRDEAWKAVGPIWARILAQVISWEKREQERTNCKRKNGRTGIEEEQQTSI